MTETIENESASEIEAPDDPALMDEVNAIDVSDASPADELEAQVLRYLRRRLHLVAEITRVKEQTDAMIRGLESKLGGLDFLFSGSARQYCTAHLAGKSKSVKTKFGTLGFRTVPGGLVVEDETKLIDACEKSNDLSVTAIVTYKPTVSRKALKDYMDRTGELLDGCSIKEPEEKFYIK